MALKREISGSSFCHKGGTNYLGFEGGVGEGRVGHRADGERERKGDEEKEETSSPRTHIIIRVTQFISRDCTDGRRNLREKTPAVD